MPEAKDWNGRVCFGIQVTRVGNGKEEEDEEE